jgi:hypothetical protein
MVSSMGNALSILKTERLSRKMNTKMIRDKKLLIMITLDKSSVRLK